MPDIMTTEQVDLRRSGTTDAIRAEELIARRNAFVNNGFTSEWISALELQRPTLYSPLVLEGHIQGLRERGFSDPTKMINSLPPILGLALENIDAKLAGLKERGFSSPNKMIETLPPILSFTLENIDAKLAGLRERGLSNPTKMIASLPQILGYTIENIDAKIAGLKERGFSNPNKIIESSPDILSYAFENIDAKIAGLKERGFSNPNRLIESFPSILGLAFENIDAKLAGLKERGFSSPNNMIESSPSILGLAFENIDRKLKLFSKLIQLYRIPFSATALMEQELFLFSSKIDKILVLVRILREYKVKPYELTDKVIHQLLRANLEYTLIALDSPSRPNEKVEDLIRRTNSISRQKLPKQEKREIIKKGLLEFEKIKERYFRGYPESIKQ